MGIYFRELYFAILESDENEIHIVVFVTLFAANFIDIQQCKLKSSFLENALGRGLFSRDLIFAGR